MTVTESPVFKLEEFSWQWPDRLEVTGQWRGIEPTRLRDPVLLIKVGGDARTLTAHVPRAPERALAGHRWRASFRYAEDPVRITGAELRASPGFAVALPPPSATRRRFERLVLDVRVEGEAALAAVRAEAEPTADAATIAAASETSRLHDQVERGRRELIEQQAAHAEDARKLRQELREERTRIEQLAREAERHEAAHAAAEADIVSMGHQLRAMKESRDQLDAESQLEAERLRHAQEELRRARSREAAEVERLSATVRTVRAAIERLTLDHRAVLRRLAEELDSALDRIESAAVESAGQAEIVRRALAGDAAGLPPIVGKRLDAVAQQTGELAELARALRRRVARIEAPDDEGGPQGGR